MSQSYPKDFIVPCQISCLFVCLHILPLGMSSKPWKCKLPVCEVCLPFSGAVTAFQKMLLLAIWSHFVVQGMLLLSQEPETIPLWEEGLITTGVSSLSSFSHILARLLVWERLFFFTFCLYF